MSIYNSAAVTTRVDRNWGLLNYDDRDGMPLLKALVAVTAKSRVLDYYSLNRRCNCSALASSVSSVPIPVCIAVKYGQKVRQKDFKNFECLKLNFSYKEVG